MSRRWRISAGVTTGASSMPTPDDLAGQVGGARHAQQQVLLLGRVEGVGGGQAEEGLKMRRRTAPSSSAVGTRMLLRGRDAQAVVGRPVAVGEEDQRVVVAVVARAGARAGPGVTGPCSSIQRRSSSSLCSKKWTLEDSSSKPSAVRRRATGKRRTGRPPTVGEPRARICSPRSGSPPRRWSGPRPGGARASRCAIQRACSSAPPITSSP